MIKIKNGVCKIDVFMDGDERTIIQLATAFVFAVPAVFAFWIFCVLFICAFGGVQ